VPLALAAHQLLEQLPPGTRVVAFRASTRTGFGARLMTYLQGERSYRRADSVRRNTPSVECLFSMTTLPGEAGGLDEVGLALAVEQHAVVERGEEIRTQCHRQGLADVARHVIGKHFEVYIVVFFSLNSIS